MAIILVGIICGTVMYCVQEICDAYVAVNADNEFMEEVFRAGMRGEFDDD